MNKKNLIKQIIKIAKNFDHYLFDRYEDTSISVFGYRTLEEIQKRKEVSHIKDGKEFIISIIDTEHFHTDENYCKIDHKLKSKVIEELLIHEDVYVRELVLSAIAFAFHDNEERLSFYTNFLKKETNASLIALCKNDLLNRGYDDDFYNETLMDLKNALLTEKEIQMKFRLAYYLSLLEKDRQGLGYKTLIEMKENGTLDEINNTFLEFIEDVIEDTIRFEKVTDNIDTLEKSIISDVDKKQLLEEISTLRMDLNELQKTFQEEQMKSTKTTKIVESLEKGIRSYDYLDVYQKKDTLEAKIQGIDKRVNDTQKSIDRIHTTFRIFIILISIVFSAITGTFFWALFQFITST